MTCRMGRHRDPRAVLSFFSVAYATGMSDRQSPTQEQHCASVHLRLWALLIRLRIGISTSLSYRQPVLLGAAPIQPRTVRRTTRSLSWTSTWRHFASTTIWSWW